jgi:hypothetical protein
MKNLSNGRREAESFTPKEGQVVEQSKRETTCSHKNMKEQ